MDATELGDVAASQGLPYRLGMDAREEIGEDFAPAESNSIIQDLTYVVTLQDYGNGADKTISKPSNYDPDEFACACAHADPISDNMPTLDCDKMLNYGKLPNGKYMINWPNCGNDYCLNIVEMNPEDRSEALEAAKQASLRFIYYIQRDLGYQHLGIAEDEYPTEDNLPMIPYHRESRRYYGLVDFTLPYVRTPYEAPSPLYRTGVVVGDYTIDHHHKKNLEAPAIDFIKIRVPSYTVPLGALIIKDHPALILAEKSISVSNIVNGATRLQPVVLGISQAAGILASVAVREKRELKDVSIREVQQLLLDQNAYIMPFLDMKPEDKLFQAMQKIGATGILKGEGVPYLWANQT
ncbi:FAD-dependent oxidoreductase [Algoriphagus persicinus]|uniref:FAD-dependent oxidoreductase n=1 Tax=Algoriphagus persicinus TaxID=3108754 RepID=UPI002B3FC194|nr:FAD-dependent oxidoreductase [Algoriphagus sp. E1-3-M2]MEB2785436.1 FAD-dependent oxidoreductase [Algoriphagus sp. E1-3-M2]